MIRKVFSKLLSLLVKTESSKGYNNEARLLENIENLDLTADLTTNLQRIKQILGDSADVVIRTCRIGWRQEICAAVIHIDGMVDKSLVNDDVMKALMLEVQMVDHKENLKGKHILENIRDSMLPISDVRNVKSLADFFDSVLSGDTAILVDGSDVGLVVSTRGWKSRNVEEPASESVVRGPRDGFTENLRDNTALVRRRIKTPHLRVEAYKIGKLSRTDVEIVYIKGIADEKVVEEVRRRLRRIDVDHILESGYIEELIEDAPFSLFSTVYRTERPDKLAGGIFEGRVGILIDNTPFALLVPSVFAEWIQAAEDYYERYPMGSLIRLLRIGALLSALLLPSFYVAITTYHQEMLPTVLLLSISAAREGVPFPAIVEAFIMELSFEVLREAGIRLPRPIGPAISIIGGVIIGDAAVRAGLVGAPMVVVVAFTGIASYAISGYTASITMRFLRFGVMVLGAALGLYGVMLAVIAITAHIVSLRSFGVPYLSPIAPFNVRDLKDVFLRVPWWAMFKRPRLIGYNEPIRQDYFLMPRYFADEEDEPVHERRDHDD